MDESLLWIPMGKRFPMNPYGQVWLVYGQVWLVYGQVLSFVPLNATNSKRTLNTESRGEGGRVPRRFECTRSHG